MGEIPALRCNTINSKELIMAFNKDFMWGAATAAYQIEGAAEHDGRKPSIWDVCSRRNGRVAHNENGDVAADHYNRYKEDVKLFKELGIKYYRFSISWSRIIPDGVGKINPKGIEFYNNLINELISAGIEPVVTLFHWDLPYELYLKGGFMNDDYPRWFEEYTKVCIEKFSDRVRYWITYNEPQCMFGLGYYSGIHAPFLKCDLKTVLRGIHNMLLSNGRAIDIIRNEAVLDPKVGMAPTGPCYIPEDDSKEEIEKARLTTFAMDKAGLFGASLYMDPVILGKYPEDAFKLFGDDMPFIKEGDMELIHKKLDFYAMNIYFCMADPVDSKNEMKPYEKNMYATNEYTGSPRTEMHWSIDPKVLYWAPKFMYERYKLPIIMSENGYSGTDVISLDGKVHDPQRIDYITRYLRELSNAADEVPVIGYFYWSAMDNFEWAEGYTPRFGLIYVDYRDQRRILKDSASFYRNVIETNGKNL